MDSEWRKSSRSGSSGGQCVEVRQHDAQVQTRDSKDPAGPVLSFNLEAWTAFVQGVRDGEFDPTV